MLAVSGFGFHPGLRRTIDYLKVAPFQCCVSDISTRSRLSYKILEEDIHQLYEKLNILGALATQSLGYVRHTGGQSHVPVRAIISSGIMRIVDGKLIELDFSILLGLGYCKSQDVFVQNIVNTCKSEDLTQKECDMLQASVKTSGAFDRLHYLNERRNCGKQ